MINHCGYRMRIFIILFCLFGSVQLKAQIYINDDFSAGLNGWTFSNSCGGIYSGTTNAATGSPVPSAFIQKLGCGAPTLPCAPELSKTVNFTPAASEFTLSYDYRAVSNFSASSVTSTRLHIINNDDGSTIFNSCIVCGGTTDTGWQNYTNTFNVCSGVSSVTVVLYTADAWTATPWCRENYWDNILLNVTSTTAVSANVSGVDIACNGENNGVASVTPSGASSYTYEWNTVPQQTTSSISGLGAGTYTVTVTSAGCTVVDSIKISEPPVLDNSIGILSNIDCNGNSSGSVTTTASGGTAPYAYLWSTVPMQTTQTISGLSANTYIVTVSDANGCNDTSLVNITEPSVLVGNVISTVPDNCDPINVGEAAVEGSGGTSPYSYLWNTNPGQSTSAVTGLATGSYSVTVYDSNNCEKVEQVSISMINELTVDAGSDVAICQGKDTTLMAMGGTTFEWSPSTNLSDASIFNPVANPSTTTQYYVTITDGGTCIGIDSIIVTVNSLPNASAGSDLTICEGESDNLNGSGGTSYVWAPGTGLNDNTISNPLITPTSSMTYTVTVTDINGCQETDEVLVTVETPVVANAGEDMTICEGESAGLVATGGTNYSWSPGATLSDSSIFNPQASPIETTTYSVSVSGNSCPPETDDVVVTISGAPNAEAGEDVTISVGNTTQLSGEGGTVYAWSPTETLSCDDCQSPIASPEVTTTYSVTVTNDAGCDSIDMVTVFIDEEHSLFIPNIFSPNGDGNNDVYQIHGTGIVSLNVKIFDRWGAQVAELAKLNDTWDGSYRGSIMNSDAFGYFLEVSYVDGTSESHKGTITLVR